MAAAFSTLPVALRFPASVTSIRACSQRSRGRRQNSPMPIPASSPRTCRSAGRPARRPRTRRPWLRLLRQRGSEAVEASIKLARQYFNEIGQPQRQHFIARRQSYHGNTLGALSAGGNAWRREPYAPLLSQAFSHVSPAFAYHEQRDAESETDSWRGWRPSWKLNFQRLGPDTVAAFHGRAGGRRHRRMRAGAGRLLPRRQKTFAIAMARC